MQQIASILRSAEQAGLLDMHLCMIAGSPKRLQSKPKKSAQTPHEGEFLVSACKWFTLDGEGCDCEEQTLSIGGQDVILQVWVGSVATVGFCTLAFVMPSPFSTSHTCMQGGYGFPLLTCPNVLSAT